MKKFLLILGVAISLVSCSKGPESAAKNFTESIAKGDMVEAKKYATSQSAALLDMAAGLSGAAGLGDKMPKYPDYKFEMIKDSIVGDSLAWVTYTTPEGKEDVIALVKENNEWKVSMGK